MGGGLRDVRGDTIKSQLKTDYNLEIKEVRSIMGYQINSPLTDNQLSKLVDDLFTDPIIEIGSFNSSLLDNKEAFEITPEAVITVGFRPGVTDNRATAAHDGFATIFPELSKKARISTTISYVFFGLGDVDLNWLSNQLHNSLIETVVIADNNDCMIGDWPELGFPELKEIEYSPPSIIDLNVSDSELIEISEKGLLALNLEEMKTIQANYQDPKVQEKRKKLGLPPNFPTDVELECLAQSWSEHCKHKIFAAKIHHIDNETGEDSEIDSLFKTYIMRPALEMQQKVDWLLSLFHDNSGVIEWT
ncbi:MAG: phosphoribosylformylglycinamidine synthase, partial [Candidatus Thermoplasmatota archaeon]|nr:phosphoribosylformylglycinamidine synthase [Candidatus Thermoplasmatota archaeon]